MRLIGTYGPLRHTHRLHAFLLFDYKLKYKHIQQLECLKKNWLSLCLHSLLSCGCTLPHLQLYLVHPPRWVLLAWTFSREFQAGGGLYLSQTEVFFHQIVSLPIDQQVKNNKAQFENLNSNKSKTITKLKEMQENLTIKQLRHKKKVSTTKEA